MVMRIVGVIGAGRCDGTTARLAEEVGELLARRQVVVLTGGRGGVMEAASRGAKKAGGLTVGILPGCTPGEANVYVDVPIATGLREARNAIVARAAEVLIAIAGEYGTLSEIAFALKIGRCVVGLGTWAVSEEVVVVANPQQAVERALDHLANR